LYRCVAVFGNRNLREAERWHATPVPKDDKLKKIEEDLAKDIQSRVISLLESSFGQDQLQRLNVHLHYNLRSVSWDTNTTVEKRIAVIRRGLRKTDPLELLAIAHLMKTQIHLFHLESSAYRLFAKYPPHAYSLQSPIMLLYLADGFDVILLNNRETQSTAPTASCMFEEFAQTTSVEDKKIRFEQLIDQSAILSNKTNKEIPSSGMNFLSKPLSFTISNVQMFSRI